MMRKNLQSPTSSLQKNSRLQTSKAALHLTGIVRVPIVSAEGGFRLKPRNWVFLWMLAFGVWSFS